MNIINLYRDAVSSSPKLGLVMKAALVFYRGFVFCSVHALKILKQKVFIQPIDIFYWFLVAQK